MSHTKGQLESQIDAGDVLDLLTSLVDKSLVAYEEDAHGRGRYRLLETVRQYGRDRLEESTEESAVHECHQSHFLAWAEKAEALLNSPEQIIWLKRLELEYDNMRAALDWSLEEENGAEASLRMAIALGSFWLLRGDLSEGRQWLNKALQQDGQNRTPQIEEIKRRQWALWRCQALSGAANMDWCLGKADTALAVFEQALTQARDAEDQIAIAYALRGLGMCKMSNETVQDHAAVQALFDESLALFRQAKHPIGITYALRNLGDLAEFQDDYATAQALYSESLSVSRQLKNKHGIAASLVSLARVAFAQGDFPLTQAMHEEALSLSREMGDQGAIFHSLGRLGQVAFVQEDFLLAQALYKESLPIAQQLGHPESIAYALAWLGRIAVRQGDQTGAWALHTDSLQRRRKSGHLPAIANGLAGFAEMAQSWNQFHRAAILQGSAHALRQISDAHLVPVDRDELNQQLTKLREALGQDAFAAAFTEGEAMALEEATEYALAGVAEEQATE
jgi:tetratricopeptide (TPR) repeat protein